MEKNQDQLKILLKGSAELNKMFDAVARTGAGLRRDFGEIENLQQSLRGARGFVQKAATRIEEDIISGLTLVRPNAGILTPNVSKDGDGRDEFVLSLSGAANFVRGNPDFAISLALRSGDETKAAIIYSPVDDRVYYAEKDNGAQIFSAFHSVRINVSETKENPSDLTIGYGNVAALQGAPKIPESDIRLSGCPAMDLAWVAAGKFDAFIAEPLDYAETCAGELIVKESGGKVFEKDGLFYATNRQIF